MKLGSTLESRAIKNHRGIDTQWIKENEVSEDPYKYYTSDDNQKYKKEILDEDIEYMVQSPKEMLAESDDYSWLQKIFSMEKEIIDPEQSQIQNDSVKYQVKKTMDNLRKFIIEKENETGNRYDVFLKIITEEKFSLINEIDRRTNFGQNLEQRLFFNELENYDMNIRNTISKADNHVKKRIEDQERRKENLMSLVNTIKSEYPLNVTSKIIQIINNKYDELSHIDCHQYFKEENSDVGYKYVQFVDWHEKFKKNVIPAMDILKMLDEINIDNEEIRNRISVIRSNLEQQIMDSQLINKDFYIEEINKLKNIIDKKNQSSITTNDISSQKKENDNQVTISNEEFFTTNQASVYSESLTEEQLTSNFIEEAQKFIVDTKNFLNIVNNTNLKDEDSKEIWKNALIEMEQLYSSKKSEYDELLKNSNYKKIYDEECEKLQMVLDNLKLKLDIYEEKEEQKTI